MATGHVDAEPGVEERPDARWVPVERCLANPRNPRDGVGDLSDLAGIVVRQVQSCLAITPAAYLKLWPEDAEALSAGSDDVVIINGNRRRAAAVEFGRTDLMVIVDDSVATSKASVLRAAYDENVSRKDFDPIEEARAVMDIVTTYASAKEAAAAEGWSQPWISHRKNLLKIHPVLQDEVRAKAGGGEGISINVARRLGSLRGIEGMALAEQRKALADLLRADAEASAAKKAERRTTRKLKADTTTGAEPKAGKTSDEADKKEFSAENPSSPAVPEPRPELGGASTDPSADTGNAATGKDEGAADSEGKTPTWVMPADAVRAFSEAFIAEASATGAEPEDVMWAALDAIRPLPKEAPTSAA
ncbi:ParB/RepB/Spo0J family partition protein [Streptomyces klenkii]